VASRSAVDFTANLAMLPILVPMPIASISPNPSALCVNVEQWIDKYLDDALDSDYKLFAKSKVDVVSGSQLIGLIEMTPGGITAQKVLNTLPYYLCNAIMNFICHKIFEQELYGAEAGPWQLFHTIETSMRNLEPRRGRSSHTPTKIHKEILS
jgi:hypothetical protein